MTPSSSQPPRDPAGRPDPEVLLERHLPGLRAFVSRRAGELVRRRETSADLAQSVCREILEHRERFVHGDEESFRQWLYRTAERKLVDRARYHGAARRDARRDAHEAAGGLEASSLFSTPSHDAAAREELARARDAFAELPERTRRVIVLARVHGLTSAQIADELGCAEGTVRSLLSRGLARISDRLDGDGRVR